MVLTVTHAVDAIAPGRVTPLSARMIRVTCQCGASYQVVKGTREIWCPKCERWLIISEGR